MRKIFIIAVLAAGLVLAGSSVVVMGQATSGLPSPSVTTLYPNASTTGTTLFTLTKLTGAPSTAVIATTTDTGGVVGVCVAGCGTSGVAAIQVNGLVNLLFDGATTSGDYVQISSTNSGYGHDAGNTCPSSGQVVGRVLSTNSSIGTYQVNLGSNGCGAGGGASGGITQITGPSSTVTGPVTFSGNVVGQSGSTFTFNTGTINFNGANVAALGDSRWTYAGGYIINGGTVTGDGTTITLSSITIQALSSSNPGPQTPKVGDSIQFGSITPSCLNWFSAKITSVTPTSGTPTSLTVAQNTTPCTGSVSGTIDGSSGFVYYNDYTTPGFIFSNPIFANANLTINAAQAGITACQMATHYNAVIDPFSPAATGTPGYIILQIGANDIAGGISVSTIEGCISSLWTTLHNRGWKIINTTIPQANVSSIGCNTLCWVSRLQDFNSLNDWLRVQTPAQDQVSHGLTSGSCGLTASCTTHWDSMVDIANWLSNFQSTDFYGDGLHPTTAMDQVEGQNIAGIISTMSTFPMANTRSGTWTNTCYENSGLTAKYMDSCGPIYVGDSDTTESYTLSDHINQGSSYPIPFRFYGDRPIYTLTKTPDGNDKSFGIPTDVVLTFGSSVTGPGSVGLSRGTNNNEIVCGNGNAGDTTGCAFGTPYIKALMSAAPTGSCTSAQGGYWVFGANGSKAYCPVGGGTWTADGGSSITVDGSSVSAFSSTSPAAPSGGANLTYQRSGTTASGYIAAATASTPGVIKPDGITCTTASGVLTCTGSSGSTSIPICTPTSGSGTAYACTTSPSFTPVAGSVIAFKPDVSNTGNATLNVNASVAASIAKWQNVTTLAANDFRAGTYTVLTYDGTNWEAQTIGNAPSGGGSGALVLLQTVTASNSVNLDLTSWYSSTYDLYKIEIVGLNFSTGLRPQIQFSTDGGATWLSENYYSQFFYRYSNAFGGLPQGSGGGYIQMRDANTTTGTSGTFDGSLTLYHPGMAAPQHITGDVIMENTACCNTNLAETVDGWYTQPTAINAIRFSASTGNFVSGHISIYGVAH